MNNENNGRSKMIAGANVYLLKKTSKFHDIKVNGLPLNVETAIEYLSLWLLQSEANHRIRVKYSKSRSEAHVRVTRQ